MKAGYSTFFIIAILVYVLTANHKGSNSDDQKAEDNACASAIEQYQEAVFPRDKWVKSEARILAIPPNVEYQRE